MVWLFARQLLLALALSLGLPDEAAAEQIRLRVIGGFAGTRQFDQIMVPFWTQTLPALTGGQIAATLQPFAQAGVEPEQMLNVMRSGVVLFGTVEANAVAMAEPELAVADLPLLALDTAGLRQMMEPWLPRFRALLEEQYGAELLATFIRPPQVVFCSRAFASLLDLKGRRVRVASANQSDLLLALGAEPVVLDFGRVAGAMRERAVDCAVTGIMPGNAIGLHRLSTHMSVLPLGWAMSFLIAHRAGWEALPEALRTRLREGIAGLEAQIWRAAEEDWEQGEACNFGEAQCLTKERGQLVPVRESAASRAAIQALFGSAVVPGWARRCGITCAERWNAVAGPVTGVFIPW